MTNNFNINPNGNPVRIKVGAINNFRIPRPNSPPLNVASWPNEPVGWTLISDTDWESATLGTWTTGTRSGWSLKFQDSTRDQVIENINDSIIGESRVMSHRYPPNHIGGGGAEPYINIGGNYRSLYIGMYVQFSSNWYGHDGSGINKIAYISTEDELFSAMWIEYRSPGSSEPLEPYLVNQLVDSGGPGIETTLTSGYPVRGNWHRIEVRMDLDTPRRVRYWVDGVLWIDNNTFTGAASGRINGVTLSGIMGGIGNANNPQEQFMRYDRVRILCN
jgi:hypothetical protein